MANGAVSKLHPGIFLMGMVALLVWVLLDYTMLGRGISGLGGSHHAVERGAFNLARIQYFIYGFVGLLAGVAGMAYRALRRQ